jgi:hypothetical protein
VYQSQIILLQRPTSIFIGNCMLFMPEIFFIARTFSFSKKKENTGQSSEKRTL